MLIDLLWSVRSRKPRIPNTYSHSRIVIWRDQWIALSTQKPSGSQCIEHSMQSCVLIDGN